MNSLKAIMRLITGPVGAVVIFVGGGCAFGYVYFNGLSVVGAPDPKPGRGSKLARVASAQERPDPVNEPRSEAASTIQSVKSQKRQRNDKSTGKNRDTKRKPADSDEAKVENSRESQDTSDTETTTASDQHESVTEEEVAAEEPSKASPYSEKRAQMSTPERTLDKRGLVKVGVYYVLPEEKEIGNDFRATIPIFNLIEAAYNTFQAIIQQEAIVQSLDDQKIMLETRINDIQIELGRIAGSRLPEDQVLRASLNEELPTRREQLSDTIGTLRIAVKRLVPPAKRQAVYDEFMKQRDAFLAATNELRPKVDKIGAEYRKLKADPAVNNAVRNVAAETNAPITLGPSKSLKNAIGKLTRAERWLSIDESAYRRGYKPRSKPTSPKN